MTTTTNDGAAIPRNMGRHFCVTKTTYAVEACKPLPPAWIRADELFKQANALYLGRTMPQSPRLDCLIKVGRILQQLQKLLGEVDFEGTLRDGRKIEFSLTSTRRFMRLARHADVIHKAGLTKVMQADQLALTIEDSQSKAIIDTAMTRLTATQAATNESRVFNDMNCFPAAYQPAFLADILGRLTRLQGMFA